MHSSAELVISQDGNRSVWADLTPALIYATRVHGIVHHLITQWEARQLAKEAYERGLRGEPYEELKID